MIDHHITIDQLDAWQALLDCTTHGKMESAEILGISARTEEQPTGRMVVYRGDDRVIKIATFEAVLGVQVQADANATFYIEAVNAMPRLIAELRTRLEHEAEISSYHGHRPAPK